MRVVVRAGVRWVMKQPVCERDGAVWKCDGNRSSRAVAFNTVVDCESENCRGAVNIVMDYESENVRGHRGRVRRVVWREGMRMYARIIISLVKLFYC